MGAKSAGASARKATEDAFYSFSDFWRDVEKDLEERNKRRGGKPASLWEELGELGGDFLEFLEKELGLPPEDTAGRKANREAAQVMTLTMMLTMVSGLYSLVYFMALVCR
jgi:hypothetical protein